MSEDNIPSRPHAVREGDLQYNIDVIGIHVLRRDSVADPQVTTAYGKKAKIHTQSHLRQNEGAMKVRRNFREETGKLFKVSLSFFFRKRHDSSSGQSQSRSPIRKKRHDSKSPSPIRKKRHDSRSPSPTKKRSPQR